MRHPFDGIIGQALGDAPAAASFTEPTASVQGGLTRRSLLGRVLAVVAALCGVSAAFGQQRLPAGSVRLPNGNAGGRPSTRWYWEEGGQGGPRPSSHVYYEDGGRPRTTTLALGETGGRKVSSRPSTRALGEEGGQKRPATRPSAVPVIVPKKS
jgi:hypothetical protein